MFQCLINDILKDFLGCFVIVYINDILIFSTDYAMHDSQVQQVLVKLRENHLYVRGEVQVSRYQNNFSICHQLPGYVYGQEQGPRRHTFAVVI